MGIYKININMIIYGGPYVHEDTGVTTSVTVEPVKDVTSSDRGTQAITIAEVERLSRPKLHSPSCAFGICAFTGRALFSAKSF